MLIKPVNYIREGNMGTIRVSGYAEKRVNADQTVYNITFLSKDVKSSAALDSVRKQCDAFLEKISEAGIDIARIHLDKDGVNENSYYESKAKTSRRVISFRTGFDPKINNRIIEIISQLNLNVEISTEYVLSGWKEIHEELIKKAVMDSKRKAELIAEANGQKVKYISSVSDEMYDNEGDEMEMCELIEPKCEKMEGSISDKLCGRELVETETLYVTWAIE